MTTGHADHPTATFAAAAQPVVDIVTVAYNSAEELRRCVAPLASDRALNVVVVDNASTDGSLAEVADLRVDQVALPANRGFAYGCNVGWRRGSAPYVLFINPDADIGSESVDRLVRVLERDETVAIAAPAIFDSCGRNAYSLRRFPRLFTSYAQALFLHRLFPKRLWTDDLIRDPAAYLSAWNPEWVSGACLLVRRAVLEELGGWDERFFLFGEDMDLCKRVRDAGYSIRFDPSALCRHIGGASAPKSDVLPVLAASRIKYVRKHHSSIRGAVERLGIALGAATHSVAARNARLGHFRALLVATSLRQERP